ncbi:hypothetical protein FRB96_004954 [Tulasnella sp. 330]|nr:hypothetical protein FRB96_004954 [Tulasnella sp. 330]KAG8886093.1 hypothetical protein FRB97_007969 [Tulasnella sp. 331]
MGKGSYMDFLSFPSMMSLPVCSGYGADLLLQKVKKLLLYRILQAWPTTLYEWDHIQSRIQAIHDLTVAELDI